MQVNGHQNCLVTNILSVSPTIILGGRPEVI